MANNLTYLQFVVLLLSVVSIPSGCAKPTEKGSTQGATGSQGSNGHTSLISAQSASVSLCVNGGTIYNSGVDLNDNGILDGSEVTQNSIVCNGQNAPVSQFTPSIPITPCGANSSNFKEVLLGLTGGGVLSEFTGNASNAASVRNSLLPDGNYSDTDDSACNFTVATASNGDRTITWNGSSANGSGPFNPGQASYVSATMIWTVEY